MSTEMNEEKCLPPPSRLQTAMEATQEMLGSDDAANNTESKRIKVEDVETEVSVLQQSLAPAISLQVAEDDKLGHQSDDELTMRKRRSARLKNSGTLHIQLEMSCVKAEQYSYEELFSKRIIGRPKNPVSRKHKSRMKSNETSAQKKRRMGKKFLEPALLTETQTLQDDIEKSSEKYVANLQQRAQRLASLALPKCMAEFAEQAKLIKKAMEEERKIEGKIALLPERIQPKQTQGVSETNDVPEFSCGLCDETTNSMAKLIEHFKEVHGVGTLLQLGKPQKGKKHRLDNKSDSRKEEMLTCGFCGKTERSTKALMVHFVLMHPASPTTTADDKIPAGMFFGSGDFVCGLCGVRKDKDTEMMDHYRVAHPVFPPPFCGEPTKNAPKGNRRKQDLKTIKKNAQTNFKITGSMIVSV